MADAQHILDGARELLATESRALALMTETLDLDFVRAVELLRDGTGRVVLTGIGKAGIIARKISATLASTGTPSDFLHPAEASHGDLGRVTQNDILLALSNSGTTEEILRLLGPVRALGVRVVAITASEDSPLGREADIVLDYGHVTEACPLGLAPTTSTTVMLALGDALAMAVLSERNFSSEEFARFHPGGNLGRSLMRVEELMRKDEALPLLVTGSTLAEAVKVMTATPGRPGAVLVADAEGRFVGLYTDGDLRRSLLESGDTRILGKLIDELMTRNPVTIRPDELVATGLRVLREKRIDQVPVVDDDGRPVGLLDIQDLLGIRALAWAPPS